MKTVADQKKNLKENPTEPNTKWGQTRPNLTKWDPNGPNGAKQGTEGAVVRWGKAHLMTIIMPSGVGGEVSTKMIT